MASEKTKLPNFIFITGLSSAGKTTLARNLEIYLENSTSRKLIVVDGTELYENRILFPFEGHTLAARSRRSRHLVRLLKWLDQQGFTVLIPIIGQPVEIREDWRTLGGFIEIHLECSIEVCTHRDNKNLYSQVLDKNILGKNIGYNAPKDVFLRLNVEDLTAQEVFNLILSELEHNFCLD
jgi:adenylylsulfate kinase